ncbi:unnamed protein product [Moneuplotes crassus]|uniref:Uncharacterized protein n=1 Tax=Euplotes crassus TaxID=5936 RepID=A0AAD1U956_EUPCR|nr:unnamed protein product [Moneuplotes crassus]
MKQTSRNKLYSGQGNRSQKSLLSTQKDNAHIKTHSNAWGQSLGKTRPHSHRKSHSKILRPKTCFTNIEAKMNHYKPPTLNLKSLRDKKQLWGHFTSRGLSTRDTKRGIKDGKNRNISERQLTTEIRRPKTVFSSNYSTQNFGTKLKMFDNWANSKELLSDLDMEGKQTITEQTSRKNYELSKNLKRLNPIPKMSLGKKDHKTQREIEKLGLNLKMMQIHLKQIMEEEENDKVLEPNKVHMLSIYSERVPLSTKIQLKPGKKALNVYLRVSDEEDFDENDEVKFDIRTYLSTSERHPTAKTCDYKFRSQYATIEVGKQIEPSSSEIASISFTSKIGFKIYFAYCFERDPPPGVMIKNNFESDSYLAALVQPKLTTKQIIYNKVEEFVDDYEKREELMTEVRTIKNKRSKRAQSASQRIHSNLQRLQTMGLKLKKDFKTTNERVIRVRRRKSMIDIKERKRKIYTLQKKNFLKCARARFTAREAYLQRCQSLKTIFYIHKIVLQKIFGSILAVRFEREKRTKEENKLIRQRIMESAREVEDMKTESEKSCSNLDLLI